MSSKIMDKVFYISSTLCDKGECTAQCKDEDCWENHRWKVCGTDMPYLFGILEEEFPDEFSYYIPMPFDPKVINILLTIYKNPISIYDPIVLRDECHKNMKNLIYAYRYMCMEDSLFYYFEEYEYLVDQDNNVQLSAIVS